MRGSRRAARGLAALAALAAGVHTTEGAPRAEELAGAAQHAEAARPGPLPAVGALLSDLEKMVEAQESLGWTIDRYEIEDLLAQALMSVCSSAEEVRAGALAALDARIEALGGPVEEAFRRSGGDLGAIKDLLFATRVRMLLDEAMRRAAAECPFWLRPSRDFAGLQTDAQRFTISLEGGGLLVLQRADGTLIPGAGGSGRLLLGRGLGTDWTCLAGAELGGQALFDQSASETRFPIGFMVAVPLVLRRNDRTWHYDLEIAPLAHFTQDETRVSPGLRAGGLSKYPPAKPGALDM